MGILNRVGNIISGALNGLLDQVEDPITKLDQITNETQQGVAEIRKALAQLMAQRSALIEKRNTLVVDIQRLERIQVVAVSQENDPLALQAIEKANALKTQFEGYINQISALNPKIKEMEARLSQAQLILDKTKYESVLLSSQAIANKASAVFFPEGVQSEFSRIKEKIESTDRYINAATQLVGTDASIACLEQQLGLSSPEWQLAQLKAQRQPQLPPAAVAPVSHVAPVQQVSISTTISGF
jgi:phage shock protein A